ncbi:MAG: hypothetical protein NZO16_05125 [Deltaproteobacteria bacterium]|nr:hypothetical protein [Deltaproteobacteria bacterium]
MAISYQVGEKEFLTLKMSPFFLFIHSVIGILLGFAVFFLFLAIKNTTLFSLSAYAPALTGLIVSNFWIWKIFFKFKNTILVLTSRRVVRVEKSILGSNKVRSLFWKEIGKVKTLNSFFISRFINIGTLVFVPSSAILGDITFSYVPNFDKVSNFIDEILYLAVVQELNEEELIKEVQAKRQSNPFLLLSDPKF